ncbi:hypothetical protein B0T17DRAFT_124489 [Bombardia bombarda]|uniref:Uncharacterized protein n=1 Tax=Bombardia bombarda TaxID=252184 RepID=A0AA39U0S5_9PEZI|nr:hypothetical protein B0T17DRAFT_124489 [Bombardia bombarda]
MALPLLPLLGGHPVRDFWIWISNNLGLSSITGSQLLTAILGSIITYLAGRSFYNLYFHPLSKYPGPKIAAITDLWWVFARYDTPF